MKVFKNFCAAIAASAMIFATASSTMADTSILLSNDPGVEAEETFEFVIPERLPEYMSFTGTVAKIEPHWASETDLFITLHDEEGNILANVIAKADNGTYLYNLTMDEIALGDELTVYYEANRPMILIYPAQYTASVIIKDLDKMNQLVTVDRFDEELLSSDKNLILSLSDSTIVELQDGTAYEEALTNQNLVVTYTATTRSIPGRIMSPTKVVVLTNVEPLPEHNDLVVEYEFTEMEQMDLSLFNVAEMDIVVEGTVLDKYPNRAFAKDNVIMLPLRNIAEALGYEVTWNADTKSVIVGHAINVSLNENAYSIGIAMPLELSSEAVLVNNSTYVPLDFFRTICNMNNAYMFEGQIEINSFEKME